MIVKFTKVSRFCISTSQHHRPHIESRMLMKLYDTFMTAH